MTFYKDIKYIPSDTANIQTLDNITFNGSSSYSLTKDSAAFTPSGASNILLSIDGVVQFGNFTITGSTIDFGVNVPATSECDFILHLGVGVINTPADGSVTSAKLGSNAVTSAKMFSGFANGITEADQWRLTADTNTGTNADVTSNWERDDTDGYGSIGTGLTESSGIFSFPQTGTYWIHYVARFLIQGGDASLSLSLETTTNNSTYAISGYATSGNGSGTIINANGSSNKIINVTDITTHKFKFSTSSFNSGCKLTGSTDNNRTHFIAIRLGDST